MSETLHWYEDNDKYRICWNVDGDQGLTLGEDIALEGPWHQIEDKEHKIVTEVLNSSQGVSLDTNGFYWFEKREVMAALKLAKLAIKSEKNKVNIPPWAAEALAAGWKPPKVLANKLVEK